MVDIAPSPLFILSFRQRDELAGAATRGGWSPVAARRSEGVERRFAVSGAAVALVDARGAIGDGVAAVRVLGAGVETEGRALLVLVSRGDVDRLPELLDAGATHFLVSPMREVELHAALRYAERHAARVSGGRIAEARAVAPLGWRYDRAMRSLQLTPALAGLLDVRPTGFPTRVLARLSQDLRHELRRALSRLTATGNTAFAHELPPVGRVVQHLQRDPRSGRIHSLIEPLGETPDASAAMREVFPRRSRSLASLARDLPMALGRREIEVLFQPQVDMASGQIVGVEALARWHHPRLGEVGAEALLEAAERAGRAGEVSRYLHRRALDHASRWPATLSDLRLSINVTAEDLAEPDFAETMIRDVDGSELARGRITFEVTESGLIENLSHAAEVLATLRAAGCRVAIDDFGTGYSSLAYLNALPLDYLKLDKTMTEQIDRSSRDQVVVRGVLGMARSLGLAVIAEGVETEQQRRVLEAEGCQFYQGYLCAPPLSSDALAARIGLQT